ncbi:hypothetical protein G3580_08180 [Nitrogeniibacter mangrovi]|uniref:Phage baseplate protein n=1 Tax=Nitrogeniibacter mangrovi TaxID=2016596 RepID=A0A6C1B2L6_9RHOO|nr:hypothetical protein [Nitrogeniibacter mangrovi]QID17623.1 hypothetical protein G3580_08180 [Nitrogeniibacter mangrovi]
MLALSPARLLAIWESGVRRHPIDRALLLFALAEPARDPDTLADAPLGVRNAAIMALREACFGSPLPSWADCPACGERMEFELASSMLPPRPETPVDEIRIGDLRLTLPTSRHLLLALDADDAEDAAQRLLHACLLDPADDPASMADLLDAAGEAIDAADPWADLSLALSCPACGAPVSASLDIAAYLWDELDRHTQALLDDVHTLAGAYGWSEGEILALSDTRRAAYLERVSP